jgi:hypothetical protein
MTNVRIRLPDGAVYESSTGKPGSEPGPQSVSKDAKKVPAATAAQIGAAVLKEQIARQQVIKELEDAADRWDKAAMAQPVAVGELKSYYQEKAKNARARAAELRRRKA